MVMTAVTIHAARKSAGESVSRAMSQSTMKMPLPIIEPTTIVVALKRPRLCTICSPAPGFGGPESNLEPCCFTEVVIAVFFLPLLAMPHGQDPRRRL